ncbi:hypothetical protein JXB27_01445 [Candidatus Woesearchaeota archaeon]|nr:hypothetical protein [Candidatus Woesearchaeota archaeon]
MNYLTSILLMVFASLLAAFGQICLKIGSKKIERTMRWLFKSYVFIAGVILYCAASVTSVIALRGNELSVLYPVASLNYVWVSLLSMKFLKERMNTHKWTGVALIVFGVMVITSVI